MHRTLWTSSCTESSKKFHAQKDVKLVTPRLSTFYELMFPALPLAEPFTTWTNRWICVTSELLTLIYAWWCLLASIWRIEMGAIHIVFSTNLFSAGCTQGTCVDSNQSPHATLGFGNLLNWIINCTCIKDRSKGQKDSTMGTILDHWNIGMKWTFVKTLFYTDPTEEGRPEPDPL